MKRTSFLAILMAFVCFGLYSCSSDPLEESRDPSTRAATAGFDEFYSNLQQFVNGYADQAQLTPAEKQVRDKYIFSAGFGTWYAASSSFEKSDLYNAVYLGWKLDREFNPSTRSVMDEATLEYLESLLTTTYTVDHASKILPGTLTLKNSPAETAEPAQIALASASIYGEYVGLTASYGDIFDKLKSELTLLYYFAGLEDPIMMELLLPRVTPITGGTINDSEAREKMHSSYEIMTAAFGSSNPFSIDSGIAYLKTLYPQSADELSVLGLYMSKLSRLEYFDSRLEFTTGFLDQFSLYPGALTDSQYERISAAAGTAYNALEKWFKGDESVYIEVSPTNLLIGDSNTETVTILSNTEWWPVIRGVDWLRIEPQYGGTGNGILTVTAQSNLTGEDRSGRFQIQYMIDNNTNGTVYVDVTQPKKEIVDVHFLLSYEWSDVNVLGATTGVIQIFSNTDWRVVSAPDFIYDYTPGYSGDAYFFFSTIYLEKRSVRRGELIFAYDDNGVERYETVAMSLEGLGLCTYFEIFGGEIPRFDHRGGYMNVPINTDAIWEVYLTRPSPWLSIESVNDHDYDNYTITLYASDYTYDDRPREAELEFRWYDASFEGWRTFKKTVYQDSANW